MKCPNCEVAFHEGEDTWEATSARDEVTTLRRWLTMMTLCPECEEPIVKLEQRVQYTDQVRVAKVIYPTTVKEVKVSKDVPDALRADFTEASQVLPVSPKASAALSRRVLQSILDDQGYKGRDLARQVDGVLKESDPNKVLPAAIRSKVDAIRNFGNFSAHPITDTTTLQIIDVEAEESEWCLAIISDLFEHYYVRPAEDKRKMDDLNQKLTDAGKPLVK
jgi:hypothetical protein